MVCSRLAISELLHITLLTKQVRRIVILQHTNFFVAKSTIDQFLGFPYVLSRKSVLEIFSFQFSIIKRVNSHGAGKIYINPRTAGGVGAPLLPLALAFNTSDMNRLSSKSFSTQWIAIELQTYYTDFPSSEKVAKCNFVLLVEHALLSHTHYISLSRIKFPLS